MDKVKLIELVVRHLEVYPEDWKPHSNGVQHVSGIIVSSKRLFGFIPHTTIRTGDFYVSVNNPYRRRLHKAYKQILKYIENERERESLKAIEKVFLSTAGRKPADLAKKKVNGDI